jgi:hypothetical protein
MSVFWVVTHRGLEGTEEYRTTASIFRAEYGIFLQVHKAYTLEGNIDIVTAV